MCTTLWSSTGRRLGILRRKIISSHSIYSNLRGDTEGWWKSEEEGICFKLMSSFLGGGIK